MNFWQMSAFADGTETAAVPQAVSAAASSAQPSLLESLIPFLFVFIVMYFLMIRPQSKKAKEHANLLNTLKPGDEVVTSGGIIGRVKNVADDFVSIDLGTAHIKVVKEHIQKLTKPKETPKVSS